MKVRASYRMPDRKRREYERGLKLEGWSLFLILTIAILMYLVMGSSQAMKAAWVEDALSMLPPLAILIAAHYRDRPASPNMPYGYLRAVDIAFLATAVFLLVLGLYILYDSAHSLIAGHHPTIGTMVLFGHQVWAGWIMIAALVYSVIPPVILGRMKLPIAKETHDKALKADADMNKADWMTGGAAILGIAGIGYGLWWADSVAALIISLDIVKDGVVNLKRVTLDLLDQRPTGVDKGEPLELDDEIRDTARGFDWVADADARLREEGHTVVGEVYVESRSGTVSATQIEEMESVIAEIDWRLHDLVITLTGDLEGDGSGGRGSGA